MDQSEQSAPSAARPNTASSRNSPYSRSGRSSRGADDAGSWKHDRFDAASRGSRNGEGNDSGRGGRAPMFFPRDKSEDNQVKPTGKVLIENLHYDVSERELKELFEQIGPVVKSFIRFDRSGRSTGKAVVIYDNPNHAMQAKNEYDGAKAKGQVISITQELRAERPQKLDGSHRSLLSRFDLSSRFDGNDAEAGNSRASSFANRLGPAPRASRDSNGRGADHNTRMNRQQQNKGQVRGPASTSSRREKRRPVTAADLDAELEAFMQAPSSSSSNPDATSAQAAAPQAHQEQQPAPAVQDVEMS
ncbi:RNA-binding domain-containing protein [Testicularia cyperi]|uniref:RNA-binding domain-containing protein n=1 Tax=Testicularia cyperi TaxID=1882483 RepID=A0A317XRR6_9BASI|nr:RNA-binding domain-containing protein [Testicularia cyperi]